jgi:hypothetical protein
MLLVEGDEFRRVAVHNAPREFAEFSEKTPRLAASNFAQTTNAMRAVQIADMAAESPDAPIAKYGGARTLVTVPMLKENKLIGVIGIYRQEVRPFTADFEDDPSDPADTVDPRWATAALVTKPGDLWELGRHRLLCGDARGADDLARLMGGAQAAMAFLDPPYNVRVRDIVGRGRVKHTEFAMASGELSRADFVEFLKSTLAAAAAVSRDGAVACRDVIIGIDLKGKGADCVGAG